MRSAASVAALFVALMLGPANAEHSFPTLGGGGGSETSDRCAPGSYLIGVRVKSGNWVDQISLICAEIIGNDRSYRNVTTHDNRRFGGNGGGGFQDRKCEAGEHIESLGVVATDTHSKYVRQIDLGCVSFDGYLKHAVEAGNSSGRFPDGNQKCDAGEAAVGLHVRYGVYLDAVGLICDRVKPVHKTAKPGDKPTNIVGAFTSWLGRHGGTNGSLVVMQNGQLIGQYGFGNRTPSTIVPIASLTKAITATCIAHLVDAGKLGYNDKASDRLRSFFTDSRTTIADTRANNITIQHLLRHTSGLSFDPVVPPWAAGITNTASVDETFARAALARNLDRAPGTGMNNYNNVNYALLGMIIKQVTGQSYEGYCRQTVLSPHRFSDVRIGAGIPAMGAFGGWEMSTEQYADFIDKHYRTMSASADAFMNNSFAAGYGLGVALKKSATSAGKRNVWHFGNWPGGNKPSPPTTPGEFSSYFALWDNDLLVVATMDRNIADGSLDTALRTAAGK
jgi:CubicO group peptidase (beta-lactamase class C family)